MALKLYDLTEAYNTILDLIDNSEPEEALQMALEQVEGAIEVKAENIVKLVKTLDCDVDFIKAEEQRLANRRKAIENKRDWLKGYIQTQMEKMGKEKIKLPTLTLALQNNPPSVQIADETTVPAKFITIIPEQKRVDRKAVIQALKDGEVIPGCELTQGKHLRIR